MAHRYQHPSQEREDRAHGQPQEGGGSGGSTYGASGYAPYRGEGRPERPDDPCGAGEYWRSAYATQGDPYRHGAYGGPRGAYGGAGQYGGGARSYGGYGSTGDYAYGSQGQGDRLFGGGPGPDYFGTGAYSSGGTGFGGGFGEAGSRGTRIGPRMRFGSYGRQYPGRPGAPGAYGGAWGPGPGPKTTTQRRGPKNYQRSDERLTEDICERLSHTDFIDSSDVSVQVVDAKVKLEGTVPERPMKHAIEDIVDAYPGVQDIENRIRVRKDR